MTSEEANAAADRIVKLAIESIREHAGKPLPLRDAPQEEPRPTVFDLALESLKANAGK